MPEAYITRTGSFLPNEAVSNDAINDYLGTILGEARVRQKILKLNGIKQRYYALDRKQRATHDVYEMASHAVIACLQDADASNLDYLAAGSTHAPLIAPGLASLIHDKLEQKGVLEHPLEINSNAGICSSGAQALVNAARAIQAGDSHAALALGVEQPSAIIKAKAMRPPYDIISMLRDIRNSKWFMAVFLRFMLSDGAGAFLLEPQPRKEGISLKINWSFSRSFANEAPLCMQLPAKNRLLRQDVAILAKNMAPLCRKVVGEALSKQGETLADYAAVLPHMSSYYFERTMQDIVSEFSGGKEVRCWTNLATAGNTGAASIYIMLDEFIRTHTLEQGDKLILFVPESGQFNFVIISLTVA